MKFFEKKIDFCYKKIKKFFIADAIIIKADGNIIIFVLDKDIPFS